ncbi:thimet oligopeptidase-like protein [Aaosphaeria arxii CBS 175.79]|uniref:Thimet oligopeptidase-like protein n=1 Tax=Aaosphaeria arxii CBS 175.79 TaxID=1450172 RepID=A0A6A5Y2D5_9PLEO|nr:thimet oligopeptidase-like protein [Aaosphaeria arxii CBS 175.79]KAF2019409.1 thimet oligopeptidase-like protein [Aaosphaeria arxii CBS 175.79]
MSIDYCGIRIVLVSVALFITITAILASLRFGARSSPLLSYLKPSGASTFSTSAQRPLLNSTMAPPQYRKPPQLPPRFTATPESLIEDTKRLIARSRAVQDDIVKSITRETANFNNTILPVALDDNKMSREAHIIGFFQAVSTDKKLRDASTEAEKLLDDFVIESSMREDVFNLVDAVAQKKEELDPESARLLEKDHKSYIRNGLGIPAGPKRDRFKEIKKRLSEISITFQKNLNEEQGGIWFTPEELDGVPEDLVASFKKGEGENEGKVWLTFKYPDLFPTLKYAHNAETRKRVFIENENKCSENVPLFREAVLLRDEAARLLGYENHAQFRIEDKMAKTPKTVDDFLGDLRGRLAPGGKTEIAKLLELKKQDLKERNVNDGSESKYFLWDHRYYDRLMLEKDYSLDQQKISEYFPLSTTIQGMLKIFEELFGLVFIELVGADRDALADGGKGSDIVWHEDVQVYSVWDEESAGAEFVGYLYLDLFPREGKYGHAANFNVQSAGNDENGVRRYPATALVCNFSKPTPKKPSLLKHDEVVTLFHELGHGIHDLVARTKYSRFHGTATSRDYVELPSQLLENWCWEPSLIKSLSHHYSHLSTEYENEYKESSGADKKPAERIPSEMVASIISTKHVNDALFNLRQLHFGIFDMTVHTPASHEELEKLDITTLYNRLRNEISQLDGPEALSETKDWTWGNGQATFGHLIGGYDAGYYGYLSSQVYSTDIFYTVFKNDPMNGKEGRKYRHAVLEKGGSKEEMSILEDFLGRKPNTDAFFKDLGIYK